MIDALPSFEEVMQSNDWYVNDLERYPTMSKEVAARIYKQLAAALNGKQNANESINSSMNCNL